MLEWVTPVQFVEGSGTDAESKKQALRDVGVAVVESPGYLGQALLDQFAKFK